MRKSRALLSLECAIALPLLLVLIVFAIDMAVLTYAKANFKSLLKEAMYSSYEEAFQLTNSDFNGLSAEPSSLEDEIDTRLARSLLDDFYLGIDEAAFEARMREELGRAFGVNREGMVLNCSYHNILGFSRIRLDYEVEVRSLFYKFYKRMGREIVLVKGSTELEYTKHFDAITTIDCIERMAKKNKKVGDFIEKTRSMILKLSGKISK